MAGPKKVPLDSSLLAVGAPIAETIEPQVGRIKTKTSKSIVAASILAGVAVGSVGDDYVGKGDNTAIVATEETSQPLKQEKIRRACTTAKCGLDDYLCDIWNGVYDNVDGDRTRARMLGRCDKSTTNEEIGKALISTVAALDFHETEPAPKVSRAKPQTATNYRDLAAELAAQFDQL